MYWKINFLSVKSLLLIVLACVWLAADIAAAEKTLPLRIYVVDNMPVAKRGLVMNSWVEERHIREVILPEVNRIWRPANISFTLQQFARISARDSEKKEKLIRGIAESRRDLSGRSDPKRIDKLGKLIEIENFASREVSVFLFPYLGEKSQGHARRKQRRIFLGQWTDKYSQHGQAPVKAKLIEGVPFEQGSLSRTLAHELGHILQLKHPDKNMQKDFGLLMGGKRPGYRLLPEEIATARRALEKVY